MIENVEQVIREYLPEVLHMSLGTSQDDKPWVCEVHFGYDEKLNLYFRSLLSRRHSQDIAGNPRVAGNIVMQHDITMKPRGVYFEGTAKRLTDLEAQKVALAALKRVGATDAALEEAQDDEGHQFYKITVDTFYLFDARESKPSTKYELTWNGGIGA